MTLRVESTIDTRERAKRSLDDYLNDIKPQAKTKITEVTISTTTSVTTSVEGALRRTAETSCPAPLTSVVNVVITEGCTQVRQSIQDEVPGIVNSSVDKTTSCVQTVAEKAIDCAPDCSIRSLFP